MAAPTVRVRVHGPQRAGQHGHDPGQVLGNQVVAKAYWARRAGRTNDSSDAGQTPAVTSPALRVATTMLSSRAARLRAASTVATRPRSGSLSASASRPAPAQRRIRDLP